MSLRPRPARWFEALVAREDLPTTLEALARTGDVELEVSGETAAPFRLEDLQPRLDAYHQLAERYGEYWPQGQAGETAAATGAPTERLDQALARLHAWQREAEPHVRELEALSWEHADLDVLGRMLAADDAPALDLGRLRGTGHTLAGAIYVLAAGVELQPLPRRVLMRAVHLDGERCLIVVGPRDDMATAEEVLTAARARRLTLPDWLSGPPADARDQIGERQSEIQQAVTRHREALRRLNQKHDLATVLGHLHRLEWFLEQVHQLPLTGYFAWITGWSSDPRGDRLQAAVADSGARALVRLAEPPPELDPPLVLHNPWWARAFELFTRLLGTPGGTEPDPSTLVALLAPLMFGYMFGDVGQGAVLVAVGALWGPRFPLLRVLVPGGLVAMAFGVVFGSVFSLEHVIPALWVHPIEAPLPVLAAPLIGGGVVLVLGQLLGAVGAFWQRALARWWRTDGALLMLYLSLWTALVLPGMLWLAAAAGVWFVTGYATRERDQHWLAALAGGIGELLENGLRLIVNTLSFVRVGAFALAHAGLALAVVSLAAIPDNLLATGVILVLGNALIIALEGLVVSVQTTRLVLFEFFVRFLRAGGRGFRPLIPPAIPGSSLRRPS